MTPFEFFYKYAGYAYNPRTETPEHGRARCARARAAAEQRAAGWSFQWEIDQHSDSSDWITSPRHKPYAVWCCIARDESGEVRASLGGIDFGRDNTPWSAPYRRVVEAELALEGLPD